VFYLSKHKKEFKALKEEVRRLNMKRELKSGFKTILDYGATIYKTKNQALDGAKDSSGAIADMLEDLGTAVLPLGCFSLDNSTRLYRQGDNITSLYGDNKSVGLVTTKPINMFMPTHKAQKVSGFTAYYVGKDITKECAVVKVGGNHEGAIDLRKDKTEYHKWKNRTRANGNIYDFDFIGHIPKMKILQKEMRMAFG